MTSRPRPRVTPDPVHELEAELLRLGGGDPFHDVLRASDEHRARHPGCRLYSAGPRVMSLAAQLVQASAARTILDLGSGLGYSTLWLADAGGPGTSVRGIDRDREHVTEATRQATRHGLHDRVSFVAGEVADVLAALEGPVDLVHDDAWFGERPPHLDRVLALLRPGGVLTMPNWFLLEDALTGRPRRDWSGLAGPDWRSAVVRFAEMLSRDARMKPVWVTSPPLLVAVRR